MFKKNDTSEENVAKKSIRKMDKVVTGLLLSGVIASIYGVKKLRDRQKEEKDSHTHEDHPSHGIEDEDYIGDTPPQKRSLWSRIFFGNK